MNTIYRYYLPFRPPMPGAIPRGAVNVKAFDYRTTVPAVNREVYGFADYDHMLTDQEIYDYELTRPIRIDNSAV